MEQIVVKLLEIILKTDLIELQTCGLQETILEIVQVEHHHPSVESWLRETDTVIQILSSLELDFRKHLHSAAENRPLVRRVLTALTALSHNSIEQIVAQILDRKSVV